MLLGKFKFHLDILAKLAACLFVCVKMKWRDKHAYHGTICNIRAEKKQMNQNYCVIYLFPYCEGNAMGKYYLPSSCAVPLQNN
ncbi:hypothetical protein AAHE18_06G061600 [Arachis hypogaea]